MKPSVSMIFEQKPEKWGLRGDPYLLADLEKLFAAIPLSCTKSRFIQEFKKFFHELTNHPFITDTDLLWVEKYAHGCMSSGCISIEFWEKNAIPLLINRLQEANKEIL